MLEEVDVLLVNETWLGDSFPFPTPGFTVHNVPRPPGNPNAPHHFGGVAMLVRNSLNIQASIWKASSQLGYMWLRLPTATIDDKDLYLATIYLPPELSTFYTQTGVSSESVLEALTNDICVIQNRGGRILIGGDLNAHTGNALDVADVGELVDLLDEADLVLESDLPQSIPPRRNSHTKKLNRHGRLILDLCKGCELLILNGRCEGDLEGKYTLHSYNGGLSTVDYFLGSAALLAQVVKLEVLDKRPESDHCPVLLQVKIKHSPIPSRTCSVRLTQLPKLHYDKERAPEFVESLGVEIESLGSCMDPVSYLANIQTVIKNAAKRVFG